MSEHEQRTPEDQLRAALKWTLRHGVKAVNYGYERHDPGFRDHGCGCCSGEEEPPAELASTLNAIRQEMIDEKLI